jgi:hypothetical protein
MSARAGSQIGQGLDVGHNAACQRGQGIAALEHRHDAPVAEDGGDLLELLVAHM